MKGRVLGVVIFDFGAGVGVGISVCCPDDVKPFEDPNCQRENPGDIRDGRD